MPLPTRANRGLSCNRIKKKYELQYALENYKKRILTLQEKALLHREILELFPRSVQHVYLMVDFKPLLDLSRH